MTKYLVTGSSGYIGSRMIKLLEDNNLDYSGIDKNCEPSGNVFCLNLKDRDSTWKLLNEIQPSIIIHCGTFSALPYRDNLLKSYGDDSNSLLNILEFLSQNYIPIRHYSIYYHIKITRHCLCHLISKMRSKILFIAFFNSSKFVALLQNGNSCEKIKCLPIDNVSMIVPGCPS